MTNNSPFHYELIHADARTAARLGRLHTPRGTVELPTFMPVGTLGTVKGVDIRRVRETGAQIILANTYHLALRPGEETVAALGDLHAFTGWQGPILTDSGGFQVFSLADRMKVSEEGVEFRSHIDGAKIRLTPERSIAIQEQLGSDFIMAFDHVVALPNASSVVEEATWRSVRWAERCQEAARRSDQMLLAIVQGGLDPGLRRRCAQELVAMEFQGYAVGGLSVGEPPAEMYAALDVVVPELPADRPRYLMGVGRPQDLIEGVARGIDMFDCVLPTRSGRHGTAYTWSGKVNIKNARHAEDLRPLDPRSSCPACRDYSRAYLHHLVRSGEYLGAMLMSWANTHFYQELMQAMRQALAEGRFATWREETLRRLAGNGEPSEA